MNNPKCDNCKFFIKGQCTDDSDDDELLVDSMCMAEYEKTKIGTK